MHIHKTHHGEEHVNGEDDVPLVTAVRKGLMSPTDKAKLDSLTPGGAGATWDVDIVNQPTLMPQAEAEAGVATTERTISADVLQAAIVALSSGLQRYSITSGGVTAVITASAVGVAFTSAAGIGTFTIPASVHLLSARLIGGSADLSGGAYTIRLVDSGAVYNQDELTMLIPAIRFYDRAASLLPGSPSVALPYPQRPIGGGQPTVQCEGLNTIGSAPANGVDWVVGSIPAAPWALMVNL